MQRPILTMPFIILLILTVVSGSGCNNIYSRYTDRANGYSIKLPLDWQKLGEETREMRGMKSWGVIFQKRLVMFFPRKFARVLICKHVRIAEDFYNTPENYLNSLFTYEGDKIIDSGTAIISGRNVNWILAYTQLPLDNIHATDSPFGTKTVINLVASKCLAYSVVKDNSTFYTISFHALENDFETYRDIFQNIAESFKIEN
ncbi:MAG: hypothetical protein ACOY3D_00820 [Candidatus Omnitrophota bacterium]